MYISKSNIILVPASLRRRYILEDKWNVKKDIIDYILAEIVLLIIKYLQ